jgi:hypothetical protein
MAQNPDFKPIVLANVTLQYPRLKETYRFNAVEKRSEVCPPTAANAAWSVSWEMSRDDAKRLFADLKAHYAECQSRNNKLPAFSKVFGMQPNEDGTIRFQAKRKGVNASGQANKPPTVIDTRKQPIADLDFWSGSTANIRIIAFAATDPDGAGGISLLLDVVQVISPVYGSASLDDFAVIDQPAAGGLDAFDDTPAPPPKAATPPSTGSKAVPPPSKKATADLSDFG